jgi:hypothetical protein
LSRSQIQTFSQAQTAALTAPQTDGLNTTNLNALQVASLNTGTVNGLTGSQLNALSAAKLQSFTTQQVGAISSDAFLTLAAAQTANFTATQIGALTQGQVQSLTGDQLNKLGKADLQAINASSLTGTQINGLSTTTIGNLSNAEVATLIASGPNALSSAQTGALTTTQLNSLSQANLQALDATAFTTTQIKGLSTASAANLSTTQIAALSATQLNALSASQVQTFSQTQTALLGASQLADLNKAALNAVNINNLSANTVGGLTTSTLASLSAAQTASLLGSQADKLSIAQISAFTTAQLGASTLVGVTGGGLQFNLNWAGSAASAPAGLRNAAIAAAAGLATNFSSNVVVNVKIGYGEVFGRPIPPGAGAESSSSTVSVGYSQLYNALQNKAGNSAIQATAAASLSATNPINGGTFSISTAEAKALGILNASSALDGYASLSSAIPFEFNQSAASGKFDAIGLFQHELSEVLGRTGSVGRAFGPGVYTALDLFRYTSTNNANPSLGQPTRELTPQGGDTSYFSIDGGHTNLGNYNPSNGSADFADWNISLANDPFGFAIAGAAQKISGNDVTELAAIGWNLTSRGVTAAQAAAAYALV